MTFATVCYIMAYTTFITLMISWHFWCHCILDIIRFVTSWNSWHLWHRFNDSRYNLDDIFYRLHHNGIRLICLLYPLDPSVVEQIPSISPVGTFHSGANHSPISSAAWSDTRDRAGPHLDLSAPGSICVSFSSFRPCFLLLSGCLDIVGKWTPRE